MGEQDSASLQLARQFLGKEVEVFFDRPIGSKHPVYGFMYEVNYGFLEDVTAPDGENLDAYFLGTDEPLEKAKGIVKAIIHRHNDDDDKIVVMPESVSLSDQEIEKAIKFQEQWFEYEIIKV